MENFCKIGKFEKKNGYDVCRGVKLSGNLRYDLTRIYPGKYTFGHYHKDNKPELYEVISGKALFFIQNYKDRPDIIEEAYLIEANPEEKIVIPSNFSMTTINPSQKQELIVSNWVNKEIENDYEYFKKLGGACYIFNGKDFEKNENYREIPEVVKLNPKSLPKELENLDFLSNPGKYKKILTIENCYKKFSNF